MAELQIAQERTATLEAEAQQSIVNYMAATEELHEMKKRALAQEHVHASTKGELEAALDQVASVDEQLEQARQHTLAIEAVNERLSAEKRAWQYAKADLESTVLRAEQLEVENGELHKELTGLRKVRRALITCACAR